MMRSDLHRVGSLLAGVLAMLGVGSLYAISAWNAQLKDLLQYSQNGIATVSSMAMLGSYLSYAPGVVFDRIGASWSIAGAGVGLITVYYALAAALMHHPNPLFVGGALIVVGQLSAFCIFAAIVPNEGLFGEANRGKVMALLTSSYSCGGAVFAFVFHQAFDPDVGAYFHFLGALLLAICAVGWLALQRQDASSAQPQQYRRRDSEIIDASAGTVLTNDRAHDMRDDDSDDVTGAALLRDARFWLLFTAVLIIVGACLFVMSNVAFIVESLGGATADVPLMVASFSISNTLARLATGAASDVVRATHPRAAFAGLSAVLTAVTFTAFVVVPPQWLLLPVTLAGVAEGVMFGTFPVLLREAFGLRHYGKNYGLLSVANCIGYPLVFSPLSSFVYQRHAAAVAQKWIADEEDEALAATCFGPECFRPMFLLAIALSGVAFVCCVKLVALQRVRKHRNKYQALA